MTTASNGTSPTTIVISFVAIIVGGYFGYATAFPSDRKEVRSCITTMLEAARGQVGYGELRDQLQAVDAANVIEVTNKTHRNFGGSTLVTLEYRVDGRTSRVMCGQ
ncbi:hypothetical protein BC777_0098 [Yoonia maricola]|uniref:Uncharacterized protein n=1 Tax=Yoonia maricola TaxID=420999 RepID=A0A2M8WK20_9RHOB|nr:hypothetical protein [Yoonia maricola]PJI91274.1 hypothetical protein BC777_0098 [Yoonia maricola]